MNNDDGLMTLMDERGKASVDEGRMKRQLVSERGDLDLLLLCECDALVMGREQKLSF